jgi:RNA-directed DNA polymerase
MHYAFDSWMQRTFPTIGFERYCDDAVVHCKSERQAMYVRDAIARRLAECKLEMHAEKTRIVYCKDADRTGSYEHERFDFLGYGFHPRLSKSKTGKRFVNFTPAVSDEAAKEIGQRIRYWHLHKRSDETLADLARMANAIVRGWINYYGRFCPSELHPLLRRINEYLIRWAERKYKRLLGRTRRARDFLANVARREPNLFAHWQYGLRP